MQIRRGDIFYADLSPVIGCEQGGVRPVLIVQNNTGNKYSPTVIVAAITGCRFKHPLPTHVALYHVEGLRYGSVVLLEQIRTIDASRLRDYIGRINREEMADIIKTVQSFVCNQNRSSGYVITLF